MDDVVNAHYVLSKFGKIICDSESATPIQLVPVIMRSVTLGELFIPELYPFIALKKTSSFAIIGVDILSACTVCPTAGDNCINLENFDYGKYASNSMELRLGKDLHEVSEICVDPVTLTEVIFIIWFSGGKKMIGTVIDIETTGYLQFDTSSGRSQLADTSEILEVGFLNIDMESRDILTHGTLYFYKPYFFIESPAQAVHGITRDFIRQYEDQFEMNLIALNSLIQSTCLIGKNSDKFDIPFIKAFISKHVGDDFNIPELVRQLDMKAYNGGKVRYEDTLYALDMQTLYKDRFHELYFDRTGNKLPPNKKGTLEQYIAVINSGQEAVDYIYGDLNKERVTGAHGALYDAVMTYIVWCDACNAGLC